MAGVQFVEMEEDFMMNFQQAIYVYVYVYRYIFYIIWFIILGWIKCFLFWKQGHVCKDCLMSKYEETPYLSEVKKVTNVGIKY